MSNVIDSSRAPSFSATMSTNIPNITGAGATYTVICNTLIQGGVGYYNTTTGVFTTTIPGLFLFTFRPYMTNLSATMTLGEYKLITTSKTYQISSYSSGGWRSQALVGEWQGYVFAPMAVNDTASLTVKISNGSAGAGVGALVHFSAARLF